MIQHNANGMKFLLVESKNGFKVFTKPYKRLVVYGVGRFLLKDYEFIGLAPELTEEQAVMVVGVAQYGKYLYYSKKGSNYICDTVIGSLFSLCRSHNLDPNRTLIIQIN